MKENRKTPASSASKIKIRKASPAAAGQDGSRKVEVKAMKKLFEEPKLEMIRIERSDIIVTSPQDDTPPNEETPEAPLAGPQR